jgi:hypothetical protein
MRSELVFGAAAHVTNRYLLTSIAAKATRVLHRPNSRLEDTSNDVFRLFGHANPLAHPNPIAYANSGGRVLSTFPARSR